MRNVVEGKFNYISGQDQRALPSGIKAVPKYTNSSLNRAQIHTTNTQIHNHNTNTQIHKYTRLEGVAKWD